MYLALILNNTVSVYPYSLVLFRENNPTVSLPIEPTEEQLNEQNIYIVSPTNKPVYDPVRQSCNEDTPIFTDKWEQSWKIEALSEQEISNNIQQQWSIVRQERDKLLKDCDWTQLSDVVLENKEEWVIYRQALRDVTTQQDPFNIVWPVVPNVNAAGQQKCTKILQLQM